MITWLASAMRSIATWIPVDVWIWGSIALTLLGVFIGLKWTAWIKTLLGLICIYAILFCLGAILPVWLQNVAVIVAIIVVVVKILKK